MEGNGGRKPEATGRPGAGTAAGAGAGPDGTNPERGTALKFPGEVRLNPEGAIGGGAGNGAGPTASDATAATGADADSSTSAGADACAGGGADADAAGAAGDGTAEEEAGA